MIENTENDHFHLGDITLIVLIILLIIVMTH